MVLVLLLLLLLIDAASTAGEFKPITYKPCKEPSSAATAVSITSVSGAYVPTRPAGRSKRNVVATRPHPFPSTTAHTPTRTGDLPARASSTFIVHVGARPERPLKGGKITMEIKALGVKVATRHFNICKDLDVVCPVPAGEEVVAKFKFPVPFYAITMKAEVVITARDERGEHLLCLEAPEVPVVGWNRNGNGNGNEEEEEEAGAEAVAAAAAAEAEAEAAAEAAAAAADVDAAEEIEEAAVVDDSAAANGSSSSSSSSVGGGVASAPALRRREMASVAVVAQEVFLAL